MVQPVRQRFEFADYLLLEEVSTVRHEFFAGAVWAMAGGSPDHARLSANVSQLLGTQLAAKRCAVFSSDLRIRVIATGLATYPDVTVVCGALELDPEDRRQQTVINPRVVVEVLSPSTEDYDRGDKIAQYQQIPSLAAIVLVAHNERRIDVWRRDGEQWVIETTVGAGVANIAAIDCRLTLDDVYRDPLAG